MPEFIWPVFIKLDGVEIQVRGRPYSFGVKRLLVRGEYEWHERELLKGEIRPNDQIIEMGASIGILTAVMCGNLGKEGRVVSIEADSDLARETSHFLKQLELVEVVNGFGFPVMNLPEMMQVKKFDNTDGSLGGKVDFDFTGSSSSADRDQATTKCYDISKIIDDFSLSPTVLVLDIEGAETIMVSSKLEYPESIRLILIELHPNLYQGGELKEIQASIVKEGFKQVGSSGHSYLYSRE